MATFRLSQIFEHPLKSARGQAVASAQVRSEGLAFDRQFLAHTPDGTFVSGRSHPRLVLVESHWDGQVLRLSAPGCADLEWAPTQTTESSVAVWKDRFSAWDQGAVPAQWLSEFLDDEVKLAWLGRSQRPLRWDRDRRVNFADAAPLLLLGNASVEDLSRRVGEGLSVRRFRPNLVVEGTHPYEEDTWRRFRVGSVEFLNLDGCGRCEFTTVDPETAQRHPRGEPVSTLETYRKVDTGIYFGTNLMPLTEGTVSVNDPVTVLEHRRPLVFGPFAELPATQGTRWPDGPATLKCTAVHDEAPGVKTFFLKREDGLEVTWDAGQYLTLRVMGTVRRSYTLSSAPGQGLAITVKRQQDGAASTWLHDHLLVGATVIGDSVGGSFTLQAQPWSSYLFLGAGSGVTPLMSMLRFMADQDLPVDVAFLQTARTRADVLFEAELRGLQAQLGRRFTFATRITAEEGRLDHQGLVRFCPDLRDRRAFVCGPPGYRASIRQILAGTGFKVDRRYHEELYGESALEVPDDAVPGSLNFVRSGKQVPSDGRTTILQLAERAGIDLPSSCRSGDCGTCRVKTLSGEWVLACHTFPRGDLSLDL